jgi:hypothetical protein
MVVPGNCKAVEAAASPDWLSAATAGRNKRVSKRRPERENLLAIAAALANR